MYQLKKPLGSLFILLISFIVFLVAQAQTGGLPPLPTDLSRGLVLFPNAIHEGNLSAGNENIFVFVAFAGEVIEIELERLEGQFVPFIRLGTDVNMNDVIDERAASDLAGKRARLKFNVTSTGWYYLSAMHDPAEGDDNASGTFHLLLNGTASTVYDILEYGSFPDLQSDDRVLLHNRLLIPSINQYYLPVHKDDDITIELDGNAGQLYDSENILLVEAENKLSYTAQTTGWLKLQIVDVESDSVVEQLQDGTPVPLFNGVLGDILTLTPTYTPTATSTATATATPTATRTPTPRPTFTPTIDPNLCNGRSPLYSVSQTVIVDFNKQSALKLVVDIHSDRQVTIAQAYDNQILQVVDGPDCLGGVWFWQVLLSSANAYGWVPETDAGGDPFLCPQDNSECRRFGG